MTEENYRERLEDQSDEELVNILTRYISYRQEFVDAALDAACDRGIISYDLKMKLAGQISRNFSAHLSGIKQAGWETGNAFTDFVSGYTDDQIYEIIEDPSDIVIDVYHAILLTARKRELISEKDFDEYYSGAIRGGRSDEEIRRDEWVKYVKDVDTGDVNLSEAQIEEEKEKYWKCRFCSQLVDIDLDTCWNCQAERPDNIQHPDKEEVIKEYAYRNPASFSKIGLGMMGTGIIAIVLGYLHTHEHSLLFKRDYVAIALGGIGVVAGIIIAIKGSAKNN